MSPARYGQGNGLTLDDSGNVYVCYRIGASGSQGFATTKYGPTGSELWSKIFGGQGDDEPLGILLDGDRGVYVTGRREYRAAIVKYSTDGDQLWDDAYDSGLAVQTPFAPVMDGQGNIYVPGDRIAKCDSAGNRHWIAAFNSYEGSGAHFRSIALDGSGIVFAAGGDGKDMLTVKFAAAVAPSAYSTKGEVLEGGLQQLRDADDERLVVRREEKFPAAIGSRAQIEFVATSPAIQPEQLGIRLDGHTSVGP